MKNNLMKHSLILTGILGLAGCYATPPAHHDIGTSAWQHRVEQKIGIITPSGHGPDIGSDEWCQAVEFRLFNRQSGLAPCSPDWNHKVDQRLNP